MMKLLKQMFSSETKCSDCGQVKKDGRTDIQNKFHCVDCISNQFNDKAFVKEILQKQVIESSIVNNTQNGWLTFFDNIYGLDDVKELVYLTINANTPKNRLLVSPPAGAKTIFGLTIAKKMKDVIYFDAANMSGAGLIDTLINHKTAKVLVIDEIDKLNKKDMSCLLGLLANGIVVKTLKGNRISFQMNCHIIATSNSTAKLTKPILSRFRVTILPEYSDEDFKKVCEFCLKDIIPATTAHLVAETLLNNGVKDVRQVIAIGGEIQQYHSEQDIKRIITNELKYSQAEVVDYN